MEWTLVAVAGDFVGYRGENEMQCTAAMRVYSTTDVAMADTVVAPFTSPGSGQVQVAGAGADAGAGGSGRRWRVSSPFPRRCVAFELEHRISMTCSSTSSAGQCSAVASECIQQLH